MEVDEEEMASWRDAAARMTLPYDEELGVHPQCEGFTQFRHWDFEATRQDQYPLLLNFPYFDLYRKQVVKQADLVMAMYVRGDAFTPEEKQLAEQLRHARAEKAKWTTEVRRLEETAASDQCLYMHETWDGPYLVLPDRTAVATYARHHHLEPQVAEHVTTPLTLTKRGCKIWARR
jgi:hypothetical protein